MATFGQRAIAIIKGIAGRDVSNAKAIKLIKNYLAYDDSEDLAPDQIAERYVKTIRAQHKQRIFDGAKELKAKELQSQIEAAGTDAEAEL